MSPYCLEISFISYPQAVVAGLVKSSSSDQLKRSACHPCSDHLPYCLSQHQIAPSNPSAITMTLLDTLLTPYTLLLLPVLFYLLPYFRNWSIRDIPGHFPAQFTNLWLMLQCRRGKRFLVVDAAHKRFGRLVRIQPNHVSINDDKAIQTIYGHGNGFLKA